MPIIEWKANVVKSQALEKLGIGIRKEVFEVLNDIHIMRIRMEIIYLLGHTLSKKNSDFSLPMTPVRASRI
jgi:hypothetical protein